MSNQSLVLPQPVSAGRDGVSGGDGVQNIGRNPVAVGDGGQIGAAVGSGGGQDGGQIRRAAGQQQRDDCVDDDAGPLAGGGIVGHGAGNRRILYQQFGTATAGNGYRGAAHHAAVRGDAVPPFIDDARRFREGLAGFQFVNDIGGGNPHTAPILPGPGNQTPGEV